MERVFDHFKIYFKRGTIMIKKFILQGIALFMALCLSSGFAFAKEEHTSAALEHATAAAAATDAAGVKTHAAEALKHTEAAKTAHAKHPKMVTHIEEGETHLKAAIDAADKGDAAGAAKHASEAETHLKAANKK
jgi:hypothetical protein